MYMRACVDDKTQQQLQMCYLLFIISVCTVKRMTVKTGQAKTGPAGLLASAMSTHS